MQCRASPLAFDLARAGLSLPERQSAGPFEKRSFVNPSKVQGAGRRRFKFTRHNSGRRPSTPPPTPMNSVAGYVGPLSKELARRCCFVLLEHLNNKQHDHPRRRWYIGYRGFPEGSPHPNCFRLLSSLADATSSLWTLAFSPLLLVHIAREQDQDHTAQDTKKPCLILCPRGVYPPP